MPLPLIPLLVTAGVVAFAAAGGAKKKKPALKLVERPSPEPLPEMSPEMSAMQAASAAATATKDIIKETMFPGTPADKAPPENPIPGAGDKAPTSGMTPAQGANYIRLLSLEESPKVLFAAAKKLRDAGHTEAAAFLSAKAHRIRAMRKEEAEKAAGKEPEEPSITTAAVQKTGDLPGDLQQLIARAVALGTPQALTAASFALRQAGFIKTADMFDLQASAISNGTPLPPAKDRVRATMEPTMPKDLSDQVTRYLEQMGDPEKLELLARKLQNLGYTAAADQLSAKALSIRASLEAGRALRELQIIQEKEAARLAAEELASRVIVEPPEPAPIPATYKVLQGDNAWRIAQKFTTDGNRWRELVAANPHKSKADNGNFAKLSIGETLKLPGSWPARPAAVIAPAPTPTPTTTPITTSGSTTYTVKSGDNAWRISQTLVGDGSRWRELVAANPRKSKSSDGNFAKLSTGEVLRLPSDWVGATPTVAPPPPAPVPQPAPVALVGAQILAEQVRAMLAGTVKYSEDKNLVKRFQSAHSLGADGLSGAGTLSKLASLLPLGNLPTTVVYLSRRDTEGSRRLLIGNLEGLAARARAAGNSQTSANLLRAAAAVAKI